MNKICPICDNNSLVEGEYVDVGVGSIKCSPDHCEFCAFVEAGPDPFDLGYSHFEKCWEIQIWPHPPIIESIFGDIDAKYQKWIFENVTKTYGECYKTCLKMTDVFPELKIIKGTYYCWIWGDREHYWLVDKNNVIIDPTKDQFPSKGHGIYSGIVINKEKLKQVVNNMFDILELYQ